MTIHASDANEDLSDEQWAELVKNAEEFEFPPVEEWDLESVLRLVSVPVELGHVPRELPALIELILAKGGTWADIATALRVSEAEARATYEHPVDRPA